MPADLITQLTAFGWPALAALAAGALIIGVAKTSIGGLGGVAAAIFALAMPARESTAAVLALLIVGDLLAVGRYRRVAWPLLVRLVPTVLVGLVLGAWFLDHVEDSLLRRAIGVLLLAMVALQLYQRRPGRDAGDDSASSAEGGRGAPSWVTAGATGVAAGFTTMTANAAGPVMAVYFLAAGIDKKRFVGTNAMFFFVINLTKVPLAASVGLFTPRGLALDLVLIPFVLVGAHLGTRIIDRVDRRQFETAILAASALSAGLLLLR